MFYLFFVNRYWLTLSVLKENASLGQFVQCVTKNMYMRRVYSWGLKSVRNIVR